jgi:hypothetical protein
LHRHKKNIIIKGSFNSLHFRSTVVWFLEAMTLLEHGEEILVRDSWVRETPCTKDR